MVSRVVPIALNYFPRACSFFAASLTRYILLPNFHTTYPSMQALRLVRHSVPLRCSLVVRSLATTANPTHVTSSTTSASPSSATKSPSVIPLSNIEAQWDAMSKEDQVTVHQQLEVLQKKDWKELSLDEKKAGKFYGVASVAPGCSIYTSLASLPRPFFDPACYPPAYYVAFGPYGPRAPVTPPGQPLKVFLSTMGLVGVAGLLFLGIKAMCQ